MNVKYNIGRSCRALGTPSIRYKINCCSFLQQNLLQVERLAEMERQRRAKEVEQKTIEEEAAKRIEMLVKKRVEEELEKRRDEIEQEVNRRVETAKAEMEREMMLELERRREQIREEERRREVGARIQIPLDDCCYHCQKNVHNATSTVHSIKPKTAVQTVVSTTSREIDPAALSTTAHWAFDHHQPMSHQHPRTRLLA